MRQEYKDLYEFDDDIGRLDFDVVTGWLANTYWTPNISKGRVVKAAANSAMVVGCYAGSQQVGYARIVSDKTRFAYIMDVYVADEHRGKGIAQNMLLFAMGSPELSDVTSWALGTRDAHEVYAKIGFQPLSNPERWMQLKTP